MIQVSFVRSDIIGHFQNKKDADFENKKKNNFMVCHQHLSAEKDKNRCRKLYQKWHGRLEKIMIRIH